jgi:hypothetical protein
MSLYAAGKAEDRKLRILRERKERRAREKDLRESTEEFKPITLNSPSEVLDFLRLHGQGR